MFLPYIDVLPSPLSLKISSKIYIKFRANLSLLKLEIKSVAFNSAVNLPPGGAMTNVHPSSSLGREK